MYISTNGIVNFNNCDISYNTSKSGAGLYLNNGKEINIFNCNIHHNNASIYGGAIYMNNVNGSKLTIVAGETEQENTIIANNSSVDVGGAIYVLLNTTIDLDSVTFENNSGKSGGAIYAEGAIIEAKNTLFINNNAVKHGGAIYAFPYTDEETNVKTHSSVSLLDNTTFESNNAGTESSTGSYGGAVYMNSGT